MRACWSSLHQGFTRLIHTLKADLDFQAARQRRSALARFSEPGAVIDYLKDPLVTLDEKDNLLAGLVTMAQEDAAGELAIALLWLGLWRGLERLFCRRVRMGVPADEVVSSLSVAFTVVVSRLDIDRVTRVAATLLRNTERLMLYERERHVVDERFVQLTETGELDSTGVVPCGDPDLARLRTWLMGLIGQRDAALVVRVVILGESCREAAASLGLPYESARKRTQRALARLRRWMSQPADSDRVAL